jgi:hypothetical protein
MAYFTNLTLADYLSQVKARLYIDRDLDNATYTDADMTMYLNLAQIEFARGVGEGGNGFYHNKTIVDATAAEIELPEDYLEQLSASVITGTNSSYPLIFKGQQAFDEEMPTWRLSPAVDHPTHIIALNASDGSLKALLHPTLNATLPDALALSYMVRPEIMVDTTDEAPVMALFPELQPVALVAGALRLLYLNEAGEADDQAVKWDNIFQNSIVRARGIYNRLFTPSPYYASR